MSGASGFGVSGVCCSPGCSRFGGAPGNVGSSGVCGGSGRSGSSGLCALSGRVGSSDGSRRRLFSSAAFIAVWVYAAYIWCMLRIFIAERPRTSSVLFGKRFLFGAAAALQGLIPNGPRARGATGDAVSQSEPGSSRPGALPHGHKRLSAQLLQEELRNTAAPPVESKSQGLFESGPPPTLSFVFSAFRSLRAMPRVRYTAFKT